MPDRRLAIENVSVTYGKRGAQCRAVRDVSLEFPRGTLNVIMGPSGSGKTTLLTLLGCLRKPDSGSVHVEGKDVCRMREGERTRVRRNSIGFVFQAFRLFDSLSAAENVAIAAEVAGMRSASKRREIAAQLLDRVGLKAKANLRPDELSGGEKQRVAIARALVNRAPILLADEPTASLDSASGEEIAGIFRELAETENITVVVVSHDSRWQRYAHRIALMEDGKIVEQRILDNA